jgi:hypothetical protein
MEAENYSLKNIAFSTFNGKKSSSLKQSPHVGICTYEFCSFFYLSLSLSLSLFLSLFSLSISPSLLFFHYFMSPKSFERYSHAVLKILLHTTTNENKLENFKTIFFLLFLCLN